MAIIILNASLSGAVLFALFATSVLCANLDVSRSGHFHGSGSAIDAKMGLVRSGCNSLEPEHLAAILGPAYNPRYMSVTPPLQDDADPSTKKRKVTDFYQFAVDGDFAEEIDGVPAWELDHIQSPAGFDRRVKRAASAPRPWECQATVKWIDLGTDYFPRYLRSVECTKHDCWYGRFTCKARSFTVKLLRRKRGKCVYHNRKEEVSGLPQELRELWVWEERAVNFCCDCAAQ